MKYKKIIYLLILCLLPSLLSAQTCNSKTPRYTPNSQFELKANGKLVYHKTTGLLWKRCSEGQKSTGNSCSGSTAKFNYNEALKHAKNHSYAGYSDWRVPTIKELASIAELACYQPAVNTKYFPNTESSHWYWSSSPNVYYNDFAWELDFEYGYDNGGSRDDSYYVRLVRSGQ